MIDALEDILADVSNLLFELGLELQITLRQFSLQVKKLTHFVGMYLHDRFKGTLCTQLLRILLTLPRQILSIILAYIERQLII
jgi:hypothetical protein